LQKIIDIHTHTYPEQISRKACENLGKFYNISIHGNGTYAELEADAKENGVVGFLLFSVATNGHQVSHVNDYIASLVELSRSHGFETAGFAALHQDHEDYAGELERCRNMGLRGLKIHPDIQRLDLDSIEMYEICSIIEGKMPLLLHMGDYRPEYRFSEPKKLAKILDRFPKLEVVGAHFAGYNVWEEAEEYLYGRPNLWYDLSSSLAVLTPERANELIHECGTDRVMFGTDYPICHYREYLDLFDKIDLTEDERGDILYNNAKRFLKL